MQLWQSWLAWTGCESSHARNRQTLVYSCRCSSGNALIAAGTTLTLIGITWYGVIYPFKSVHVLVPFVLGLCLIFAFFAYEILFMKERRTGSAGDSRANSLLSHPATLPVDILSNRTSAFA